MFKFALLDDEKTALMISSSALEAFLKDKNVEYNIFSFSNAQNLISSHKEEKFDLVFLDIDLQESNGINVGKEILDISKDTQIIFLSQREDLIFECLALHPFGFIRKSKLIEDFDLIMNQYYTSFIDMHNDEAILEIDDKTKVISFKIREIVFIEGDRNYQKVYLKDHTCTNVRIPLGQLEEKLKVKGFIRIHKGYLLNYLYIRSITNNEVFLTNGFSLPISKMRKDEILKEYLEISRKRNTVII